jgi:hypothetical protein
MKARVGAIRSAARNIEPFARSVAVGQVEMPRALAPHLGAARHPSGDDRIARSGTAAVLLYAVSSWMRSIPRLSIARSPNKE